MREQIPPARTDQPLTPAQADALMAHLVEAINQEDRAAIEPYLMDNRRTEEFFQAAIADYKTHFKGEPISRFELEEFKNEGLWQQKPILKFSYLVYSKSGINKHISINQELGNVRMIDLCFFYSYPAKMKVERLIQSIQTGSDRVSQKMLANYRTAFDVKTLKYRFDGLDAKGLFNYTIYGTKVGNPVEHQIKIFNGDNDVYIEDKFIPQISPQSNTIF